MVGAELFRLLRMVAPISTFEALHPNFFHELMPATPASFYLQNVSTSNRIAETTKALDVCITRSAAARVSDV